MVCYGFPKCSIYDLKVQNAVLMHVVTNAVVMLFKMLCLCCYTNAAFSLYIKFYVIFLIGYPLSLIH